MILKRLLLLSGLMLALNGYLMSQTTLSQGDIYFTGISGQGGGDEFSFVTLVDLEAGTVIYFTDIAADGDSTHPGASFNNAIISYTVPAGGVSAGSVVNWQFPSSGDFKVVLSNPAGTGTLDIVLGSGGDKLIAMQGVDTANSNKVTTYLAAIANNASYGTFPAYFTETVNMGTNEDGEYSGLRNSIKDSLIIYVKDTASWTFGTNGAGSSTLPFDLTDFRLGYYWNGSTWEPENPDGVNSGDIGANNIIIAGSGASFTGNVTTTGDVYVDSTGTLDLGANTLTADTVSLGSSAGGQGQIQGAVTAMVEFSSYITSTKARWFNVGSPVGGTLADMVLSNGGFIRTLAETDSANVNIYWYNTDSLNVDPLNDEGTWLPLDDKTVLADTTGYSIYLGGGTFGSFPMTITTYGTLNNGPFSISLDTSNGGYNFINNPYATSLDFDEIYADNDTLNGTYYIFDDEDSVYISYSAPGGIPASRQFIGPGQAFFVNAGLQLQLDYQTDQQTMSQTVDIAGGQANPGILLTVDYINGKSDFTYVGLKQGVTDEFNNRYDGKKKMNPGKHVPNFYSVLMDEEYVFKFIDDNFTQKSIPLTLDHGQNGVMQIDASIMSIDPYWFIELEDKKTGAITNLRNGNYQFTYDVSDNPDRFVLHINQSSVSVADYLVDGIYAFYKNGDINLDLGIIPSNQTVQVKMYDLSGKLILDQEMNGGSVSKLNVENQPVGVYMLQVLNGEELVHSQKVMKK